MLACSTRVFSCGTVSLVVFLSPKTKQKQTNKKQQNQQLKINKKQTKTEKRRFCSYSSIMTPNRALDKQTKMPSTSYVA